MIDADIQPANQLAAEPVQTADALLALAAWAARAASNASHSAVTNLAKGLPI